MKEQPYFKHDCNARHDLRLSKIRKNLGAKGYGIYFMIIEMLRTSQNYALKLDIETIAFDIKEDEKDIENIIKNYGLFKIKNGTFYSPSLKKRMKSLDNIREGWKKGGKKRWEKDKPENQKRSRGYTQEEADKLGLH